MKVWWATVLTWLLVSVAHGGKRIEVPGKALGQETSEAWIHLPKEIEEGRRYAVLYLLHSFTGTAQEWKQLGIEEAAEGLPLILVMVDGEQDFFGDFPKRPAWESHLLQDVVPHIDASYPTFASPAGRGVLGLSMGGHAAMRLALHLPETFSLGASISGFFGCFDSAVNSQVRDRVSALTQSLSEVSPWSLRHLVRVHEPSPSQLFLIECGAQDPWLEAHRSWIGAASERGLRYEYRESPGRHDYAYWRSCVADLLPKVSARLADHTAAAERELAWQPLLGKWRSFAKIPQGGELEFETIFEIHKGALSGTSEGQEGKQRFDRLSFEDHSLSYRTYESERIIDVRAHLTKAGQLEGEWSLADATGKTVASGEWRAERAP